MADVFVESKTLQLRTPQRKFGVTLNGASDYRRTNGLQTIGAERFFG